MAQPRIDPDSRQEIESIEPHHGNAELDSLAGAQEPRVEIGSPLDALSQERRSHVETLDRLHARFFESGSSGPSRAEVLMGYGLALACKKAELDVLGNYTPLGPGQARSTGSTPKELAFISGERLYRASLSTSPELLNLRHSVESMDTVTSDQQATHALTPAQRQWIEDYFNSTLALLTTPERNLPR